MHISAVELAKMSCAAINALCSYVESVMIDDECCDFPITNKNYGCMMSKYPPDLNISEFIKYIFRTNIIYHENIVSVVIYTIQIIHDIIHKGLFLNNLTAHRIVFISLMLSSKLHEDLCYLNIDWGSLIKRSCSDVNTMEKFILEIFDNRLNINMSKNKLLSIVKCIY